ncbi:P domain-containing [Tenacibaculum phage pT24]|uniref:P domain-containing n=1 Tax=Tenacibaculum phage pT24 TaxID=1880590 RepID=A0A1B4XWU4_9CAUD|nr:P domain-containing [Tenacibaculum phage pT24]BAV39283.1 P domain-containing [Tenacibaculum phage pT24]
MKENLVEKITTSISKKEWLKNSMIKKPVFHGTGTYFEIFNTDTKTEFGSHFGTLECAKYVAYRRSKSPIILNVFLNLENVYELPDLGKFTIERVLNQLHKDGIFTKDEIIEYNQLNDDVKLGLIKKDLVKNHNIDGFKYINNREDNGNFSYIAFYPNQIKSIFGEMTNPVLTNFYK